MEFYFFEISLAIVAVIVTWMGCKAIKGIWTQVKRRISYMVGKSQNNQGVVNLNASESLASSSEPRCWKYDVFLSFRGPDTRKGITAQIRDRLRRSGIITFMDEPDLRVGDTISPTLIKAIKESRVIFDKGAVLFTTVGNNATFQPNPNSVYQTEHLSYFKFVGRVVAKAVFDGQLLDVYFTQSLYKHILGVKVTYHDIEAVDPDYYKNLKWMLENDVSDIPDLTFSMDADEEKHILYEKNQVTDYELKPGGRNIRVTEETKHEYVDLVADHILTNAIRPQINSFLEGFNELVPRELIWIFNDKELELLISGLPEIDLDDLKANTEYTGYTVASSVVQWFWEVVKSFNKEDMARLLQFVTGTSKVPLEGFKALQGISGPQRFQIHKAYGAPDRLPSAHTCFNQLDLPEYTSKDQLHERLMLAIHEGSEGFGFG